MSQTVSGKKVAGAVAGFSPHKFSRAYFDGFISFPESQNLSVKALLATEQRIPGLGNGVLQDILHKTGVHPRRIK